MTPLFAFLSTMQIAVLLVVVVLLFGRRLPEVVRYVAKQNRPPKKGPDDEDYETADV